MWRLRKIKMKKSITILKSILLLTVCASCASMQKPSKIDMNKTIEVNDAFNKVYYAVQKAISDAGETTLKLESIDLAFANTTVIEKAGGIKLWVVNGNYSRATSNSKTAVFTFGIPKPSDKLFTSDKNNDEFIQYVKSVIINAQSIKSIDNFGLTELEIEVEFTMSKTGETEAEIELSPITPSLKISKQKENTHTITLKFSNKS